MVFGVLTGIAMQSLFGEKKEKGMIGEILSGVAGAVLGGACSLFVISQRNATFTIFSYILAFIGAFFFLFIFKIMSANTRK
jgi:uncharacterized membrane protein YeaQ/YmgE (transglycosylase-associated protein family)